MIGKSSYTKNFLVLFSGNSAGQLIPFLFAPLIGRMFEEEEMAILGNFLALAGMISIIAGGRFEKAIILPSEKKSAMNLFSLSTRLIVAISVLTVFTWVYRIEIDGFYENGKMQEFMYLMIFAVPLYAFTNLLSEWLLREKRFRAITYSSMGRSAFISLFTIFFGYYSMGALGLILGTLIGLLISLSIMLISAGNSLDFSLVNRSSMVQVAKEFKDFPLINSMHAFADILLGQVVLYFIITREFGLAELGFFTVMTRYLMASMKAVGGSVGQLYYRDASERFSSGQNVSASFFRSVRLVLLFAVPVFVLIFFWGPDLFALYFGEGYRNSGEIARIMIIPIFINFIVSPVSPTPIIYRKQGIAFIWSLIGYAAGIAALLFGHYQGYDFYDSLKWYAGTQTIYYLSLFVWYWKLTATKK